MFSFLLCCLCVKYFVITHFLHCLNLLVFGGVEDATLAFNRQVHEDVWLRMFSQ